MAREGARTPFPSQIDYACVPEGGGRISGASSCSLPLSCTQRREQVNAIRVVPLSYFRSPCWYALPCTDIEKITVRSNALQ